MRIYQARISYVYHLEQREESQTYQFVDVSLENACHNAVRLARESVELHNAFHHRKEQAFGSMHVGRFHPFAIDEDGRCGTHGSQSVEWKYDWPGKVEDWIRSKCRDVKEYPEPSEVWEDEDGTEFLVIGVNDQATGISGSFVNVVEMVGTPSVEIDHSSRIRTMPIDYLVKLVRFIDHDINRISLAVTNSGEKRCAT